MRLRTEEAVDALVVETEVLQACLQGGDVVAVQRSGQLVDQRAGTEVVGRFFEGAVRGRSDDAVDQ
ncbi:unannotated protein [freshwater metagenome]|uniref:Unannotated protein n=1 Tax=freshwater metagenome TaxID=449393 RepID=A0A6J7FCE3_9ZZZZ